MQLKSKKNRKPNRTKKKNPKSTSDNKTEKPLVFFCKNRKPDAKKRKTRNRNEHQNQKTEVFWHKNRKTDLKNSQTENPNVPLLEGMAVVQKIRIQLGFVELNNGALHHYCSDRSERGLCAMPANLLARLSRRI